MKEKLTPDECVARFCRFCAKPMKLESYEYDTDYRWYNFHCDECDFSAHLGEAITEEMRSWHIENGELLEPLTKEELELQNSPLREEDEKKMWKEIMKELEGKKRAENSFKSHSLNDKSLEELK